MTLEEVIAEMVRLANAGGAGLGVTLLVLLLGAVLVIVSRKVHIPKPRPDYEPTPAEPWKSDADNPGGPGGGG